MPQCPRLPWDGLFSLCRERAVGLPHTQLTGPVVCAFLSSVHEMLGTFCELVLC